MAQWAWFSSISWLESRWQVMIISIFTVLLALTSFFMPATMSVKTSALKASPSGLLMKGKRESNLLKSLQHKKKQKKQSSFRKKSDVDGASKSWHRPVTVLVCNTNAPNPSERLRRQVNHTTQTYTHSETDRQIDYRVWVTLVLIAIYSHLLPFNLYCPAYLGYSCTAQFVH